MSRRHRPGLPTRIFRSSYPVSDAGHQFFATKIFGDLETDSLPKPLQPAWRVTHFLGSPNAPLRLTAKLQASHFLSLSGDSRNFMMKPTQ